MPKDVIREFESLSFAGEPNLLSRRHHDWSVIDEASAFTAKPSTREEIFGYDDHPCIAKKVPPITGAQAHQKTKKRARIRCEDSACGRSFL
jgi:hypothetical protein